MLMRTLLLSAALWMSLGVQAKEWLIDVRTADEFSASHAVGATNIEFQQIVSGVAKLGIAKQEPIRLYCRSGRRAESARQALIHNGYENVINLGSISDAKIKWKSKKS